MRRVLLFLLIWMGEACAEAATAPTLPHCTLTRTDAGLVDTCR